MELPSGVGDEKVEASPLVREKREKGGPEPEEGFAKRSGE